MYNEEARSIITFVQDGHKFNYRAAAVLLHEGRVLLHRAPRDAFWSLPGGRVELMELSSDTVRRELLEELGVNVDVHELLWLSEDFFLYDGLRYHELGFYYRASLTPGHPMTELQGSFGGLEQEVELEYRWFALEELADIVVLPAFIPDRLCRLDKMEKVGLEHIQSVHIVNHS
ncbi:NUDIX hydrolase [Paenibacillus sp. YYML68]|uniref:NUDIX hydrolase n=1 Tax=Paenibacillus sp. YYML68 TaxID=2909250 RepID=UPI00249127BC|nr:NUDIX hydrolase [Paenibacillus sp. YYML68]